MTTTRVITAFRFLSLIRQEITLENVRGVRERKTVTESLVGPGTVRVASGSRALVIEMRTMPQSAAFAAAVRDVM